MLVMSVNLSLCFVFPAVTDSVRRTRQWSPHPKESLLMPAGVVWISFLFCPACRMGREGSNHGVEGASMQLPGQPDRWRLPKTRRGTQVRTSLPLLKREATEPRGRNGCGLLQQNYTAWRCPEATESQASRVQFGKWKYYWWLIWLKTGTLSLSPIFSLCIKHWGIRWV